MEPSVAPKTANTDPAALKNRVTELESELEKLREQLSKAKGVNDSMWENVVSRMVTQNKDPEGPKQGESDDSEMDNRRRKRGRAM